MQGGFLLIGAVLVFAVGLVVGFDRVVAEEKRLASQQGKAIELAVETEAALLKLQQLLDRYVMGDTGVTLPDVHLQYDLLWNRLSLLGETEGSTLRTMAAAREVAWGMLDELGRIARPLSGLHPQADVEFYRVREVLDGMRAPIHKLVRDSLSELTQTETATLENTGANYNRLVVFLSGILLATALLIVLLLRENQRARAHLGLARNAEAMASEARGRLEDAIEAISEGFLLCDSNDRILMFNRRYCDEIHQGRTGVAVGNRFEDGVRDALAAGIIDTNGMSDEDWLAWRMAQRRQSEATLEVRTCKGGWLHVREYRTRDGGRVTLYTDVTEAKQREEALRAAKEEAEIANRLKSDFLANISHELRTPLNAVIGFSDMLAEGVIGQLAPKQREYVVDIRASGLHLLGIINDILDLSKAEAGRLTLDERPFDLFRSIDGALRLVRPRASAEGVSLAVDAPPISIGVLADELKLRQILLNLLSNAVKFTPAGGEVTVRVRRGHPPSDGFAIVADADPAKTVAFPAQLPAGNGGDDSDAGDAACLLISVTDTGIGMTADELDLAFQPFVQVDSGLNRRYSGTGLGLPLTRRLAELHGGTLIVRSAPGQGTDVTVVLPGNRVLDHYAHEAGAESCDHGA